MSMLFSGGTHDDRWGSDIASAGEFTESSSSLPVTYSPSSSGEELVEVTIEFPSGVVLNIDSVTNTDPEITSCSASNSGSRSRSLGWSASSSHRISELEKAKKFSRELKQKLQRISLGYSSRSAPEPVVPNVVEITDPALLCRSLTQRLTHRNGSCTQRAIHGLKFISSKQNGIANWIQVQNNFANLSKDGYICRSDFADCIGLNMISHFDEDCDQY